MLFHVQIWMVLGHLDSWLISQIQSKWRAKWQETCSSGFLYEACCHQVKTCTEIALDCLDNDSQKRPDIVKIINVLKEIETDNNKVINQHRRLFLCEKLVCRCVQWDIVFFWQYIYFYSYIYSPWQYTLVGNTLEVHCYVNVSEPWLNNPCNSVTIATFCHH